MSTTRAEGEHRDTEPDNTSLTLLGGVASGETGALARRGVFFDRYFFACFSVAFGAPRGDAFATVFRESEDGRSSGAISSSPKLTS